MPFCGYCGSPMRDTDKFCQKCGKLMEQSPAQIPLPPVTYADPAPQIPETPNEKKSRLPLIIILSALGVVLCCGIIVGVILVSRKVLAKPTEFSEETTEDTTVPEETSQTTAAETTTETTTEATTETTDPTPTPTPTEAPIAKPVINSGKGNGVKVLYAAKKVFKRGKTKIAYYVPKIVIPGKDTSVVNKKILNAFPERVSNPKKCKGFDVSDVWFRYYISDKVVSVMVHCAQSCDKYNKGELYQCDGIFVYNVSIETGKQISSEEMLALCGVTKGDFFKIVKETYTKIKTNKYFTAKDKKKTLKRINLVYVVPCIGTNGHLCFTGRIWATGALGEVYDLFDAETRKCIDDDRLNPEL